MELALARELIAKWGLVAGVPDGESGSGHQLFRMMTPTEIVARACETAELAFGEFVARGWFTEAIDDQ